MRINPNFHLGYSTNIHPAESWDETFNSLNKYTLAVRNEIAGTRLFGIGLRLSAKAAHQLRNSTNLLNFKKWLDSNNCYVFTINGFPYGDFHGESVKEKVFLPDWSSQERLEYTKLLFDILAEILPENCEGSVSTMPISFKGFEPASDLIKQAGKNLYRCIEHIEMVSAKKRRYLHLGIEPEPFGYVETTQEFVDFFNELKSAYRNDERINRFLGINYDCCHMAVEYEEAKDSFRLLTDSGIKISKVHLSNAVSVFPEDCDVKYLESYCEKRYLHQTIIKMKNGSLIRFKDLNYAISLALENPGLNSEEWRIHFHIPIYSKPQHPLRATGFHIESVMDELKVNPGLCSHFEIETYTFGVLPGEFKSNNVVEQLVNEYRFAIKEFDKRGFSIV
ncbi:MAG: metabolite traffic protein EboE [Verrucomicrobiia bacterium]